MSTDPTTGDVPPTPPPPPSPTTAPPPKSIWRRRRRWFIWSLAVVLLLLVADEVGSRLVPPDTVQVTYSSLAGRAESGGGGPYTTTHTITDAATVADLSARINRLPIELPSLDLRSQMGCSLLGLPFTVTVVLRFTHWGLPIETAITQYGGDNCHPWWWLSHGGISDLFPHVASPNDMAVLLSA